MCGLGGFAAGAQAAGAEVVFAVDADPVPLKLYGANVPTATTVAAELGNELGAEHVGVPLPPPAADPHVHISTPCQELSAARRPSDADAASGLAMIRWALDTILARGDLGSWSLENVATKATRGLLTEYAAAHPGRVAWGVFDSADFGAPQIRVRLIAGPPKVIQMLHGIPAARRVSIREALAVHGLVPPAPCCKNQTKGKYGEPCTRSVEAQASAQILISLILVCRGNVNILFMCVHRPSPYVRATD